MTASLAGRPWVPEATRDLVRDVAAGVAGRSAASTLAEIERLVAWNHRIHDVESVNLNPATNIMNPRAEALLSAGLGPRASLGYPGDKYETGLEAIEQLEIIAAQLAAEVFDARYAEVRVGSGALANLYAFMATCRPGDTVIAPPASQRASAGTSHTTPTARPGCTGCGPYRLPWRRTATPSTSRRSGTSRERYARSSSRSAAA
jgi:glycine hydroxymethyltransferase